MRGLRLAVGGLLVTSALTATAGAALAAPDPKVTLCHRTDSNTNPYVEITVSVNAANGALGHGNGDHTQHTGPIYDPTLKAKHIKWGDIIPPYTYSAGSYPGLNYTAGGAALLARHCNYVGPDLAMDKIGPATAAPGDAVTYTLTVTNQPGADATYGDITVTDTPDPGLTNGTLTPAANPGDWNCTGLTCTSSTVVLQPGESVSFKASFTIDPAFTTPGTVNDVADVDTPGDTDPSNNDDDASTSVSAAPVNPTVNPFVLSAKCSATVGKVDWTLNNPGANATASGFTVHGVSGTPAPDPLNSGDDATFTTDPPGATQVYVNGTVSAQSVDSNHVSFSDNCTPTVLPTQANPAVSGQHACKTGISVVLSNFGGTASARFAVTKPNGSTQVVTVRPDAMVKKTYAVKEDTTGTVSVTSPGLAKKSFTFKKNCSKVLGEKTVKTPPKGPSVLPFTGSPTQRLADAGLVLLVTGSYLVSLGRRRRLAHTQI
jgi:uncharacterized repeat protein (TIGR01451 family)